MKSDNYSFLSIIIVKMLGVFNRCNEGWQPPSIWVPVQEGPKWSLGINISLA